MTASERTIKLLGEQVGRSLAEVETPVAVVDLDRLERNLSGLQSYATEHGIELWPHTKTHKTAEIGMRQVALGAGGLTVAKTGEAEVFHEAGAPRLLMHYPPFGPEKADRLARLVAEGLELTVAVDSVWAAESLSAALQKRGVTAELLVELDVGLHRTGQGTAAGALAVAQGSREAPGGQRDRHQLLPGPLPGRRRDRALTPDGGRRPVTRDPRRLPGRRHRVRPGLGRLDADPLADARDVCDGAALRHLCAGRPQRPAQRGRRAGRALGRGDRHLRRGARPDRGRRGLEDAHVRLARRRRPRRHRRSGRAPTSRTSTRSTATSTSRP